MPDPAELARILNDSERLFEVIQACYLTLQLQGLRNISNHVIEFLLDRTRLHHTISPHLQWILGTMIDLLRGDLAPFGEYLNDYDELWTALREYMDDGAVGPYRIGWFAQLKWFVNHLASPDFPANPGQDGA